MRAVIQRVTAASVEIDGQVVAQIGQGILALLSFKDGDDSKSIAYVADKIINMRIFEDTDGKMNLSVNDVGGSLLIVPNFTLYGDVRGSRRPSFSAAAGREDSVKTFESAKEYFTQSFNTRVAFGVFGADMKVQIINDGPVTLLIDSDKKF